MQHCSKKIGKQGKGEMKQSLKMSYLLCANRSNLMASNKESHHTNKPKGETFKLKISI
jgi:hypothetical protein